MPSRRLTFLVRPYPSQRLVIIWPHAWFVTQSRSVLGLWKSHHLKPKFYLVCEGSVAVFRCRVWYGKVYYKSSGIAELYLEIEGLTYNPELQSLAWMDRGTNFPPTLAFDWRRRYASSSVYRHTIKLRVESKRCLRQQAKIVDNLVFNSVMAVKR